MDLIILKFSFRRIIREIAIILKKNTYFNKSIIKILQISTKTFLYYIFENINLYAIYIKRVIIIIKNV